MAAGFRDLFTPRLRLRAPTDADVEGIARLSSDPRVNEHSPTGAPSLELARTQARRYIDDWRRDGVGYWVVERQGLMIGIAGVRAATLDGREFWNLYYRFAPEAWGQGFAREAAAGAMEVAHALAPRRRVLVRTRPSNQAAARLAVAIGMTRVPSLDSDGFITYIDFSPESGTTGTGTPV